MAKKKKKSAAKSAGSGVSHQPAVAQAVVTPPPALSAAPPEPRQLQDEEDVCAEGYGRAEGCESTTGGQDAFGACEQEPVGTSERELASALLGDLEDNRATPHACESAVIRGSGIKSWLLAFFSIFLVPRFLPSRLPPQTLSVLFRP